MDVLNAKTYDVEEDQLSERQKYTQMDKILLPLEFQQAPVSTGVSSSNFNFCPYIELVEEFQH